MSRKIKHETNLMLGGGGSFRGFLVPSKLGGVNC